MHGCASTITKWNGPFYLSKLQIHIYTYINTGMYTYTLMHTHSLIGLIVCKSISLPSPYTQIFGDLVKKCHADSVIVVKTPILLRGS